MMMKIISLIIIQIETCHIIFCSQYVKYVTMFDCKQLFKEYEVEKNMKKVKRKKEEKVEIVKKKFVYANFKRYKNETLKFDENEPFLQNRYHHKGLNDFNMLKPIKIEKKKFTIQDFLLKIKIIKTKFNIL